MTKVVSIEAYNGSNFGDEKFYIVDEHTYNEIESELSIADQDNTDNGVLYTRFQAKSEEDNGLAKNHFHCLERFNKNINPYNVDYILTDSDIRYGMDNGLYFIIKELAREKNRELFESVNSVEYIDDVIPFVLHSYDTSGLINVGLESDIVYEVDIEDLCFASDVDMFKVFLESLISKRVNESTLKEMILERLKHTKLSKFDMYDVVSEEENDSTIVFNIPYGDLRGDYTLHYITTNEGLKYITEVG